MRLLRATVMLALLPLLSGCSDSATEPLVREQFASRLRYGALELRTERASYASLDTTVVVARNTSAEDMDIGGCSYVIEQRRWHDMIWQEVARLPSWGAYCAAVAYRLPPQGSMSFQLPLPALSPGEYRIRFPELGDRMTNTFQVLAGSGA